MILTHHPFQVVGAWSAAHLAGTSHPGDLTAAHLDQLADRISGDCADASQTARKGPGYAWWTALAACYPNSPPVHPGRGDHATVAGRVRGLFAADDVPVGVCWFCERPAAQRWGKALLPLGEPVSHVNNGGGRLVCRACRIALWCLPYGCGHDGATVLTIASEDQGATRDITAAWVAVNRRVIADRLAGWPRRDRFDVVYPLVAAGPPAHYEILTWRNDNRQARLESRVLRRADVAALHSVAASTELAAALALLSRLARLSPMALAADEDYAPLGARLGAAVESVLADGRNRVHAAALAALVEAWVGAVGGVAASQVSGS